MTAWELWEKVVFPAGEKIRKKNTFGFTGKRGKRLGLSLTKFPSTFSRNPRVRLEMSFNTDCFSNGTHWQYSRSIHLSNFFSTTSGVCLFGVFFSHQGKFKMWGTTKFAELGISKFYRTNLRCLVWNLGCTVNFCILFFPDFWIFKTAISTFCEKKGP